MADLDKFTAWRLTAKPKLEALGFAVTFFDGPETGNKCKRIDFKSNTLEATIAVWERGDIFADAFDHSSNEVLKLPIFDIEGDDLESALNLYLVAITQRG